VTDPHSPYRKGRRAAWSCDLRLDAVTSRPLQYYTLTSSLLVCSTRVYELDVADTRWSNFNRGLCSFRFAAHRSQPHPDIALMGVDQEYEGGRRVTSTFIMFANVTQRSRKLLLVINCSASSDTANERMNERKRRL